MPNTTVREVNIRLNRREVDGVKPYRRLSHSVQKSGHPFSTTLYSCQYPSDTANAFEFMASVEDRGGSRAARFAVQSRFRRRSIRWRRLHRNPIQSKRISRGDALVLLIESGLPTNHPSLIPTTQTRARRTLSPRGGSKKAAA